MIGRDRGVAIVLACLAVAGLAISVYLTATHLGDQPIECAGVGDCNYVNSSAYAKVTGIPVSALGAGMYAALVVAAIAWALRPDSDTRMVTYWGLALAGALYAGYLTYVELEILKAICVWCVTSALLLAAGLLLSTYVLLVPENAD